MCTEWGAFSCISLVIFTLHTLVDIELSIYPVMKIVTVVNRTPTCTMKQIVANILVIIPMIINKCK